MGGSPVKDGPKCEIDDKEGQCNGRHRFPTWSAIEIEHHMILTPGNQLPVDLHAADGARNPHIQLEQARRKWRWFYTMVRIPVLHTCEVFVRCCEVLWVVMFSGRSEVQRGCIRRSWIVHGMLKFLSPTDLMHANGENGYQLIRLVSIPRVYHALV